MQKTQVDEYHGIGGSYVVGTDGVRQQVQKPTADHPEGNAPRDSAGNLLVHPDRERTQAKPRQSPGVAADDSAASSRIKKGGA